MKKQLLCLLASLLLCNAVAGRNVPDTVPPALFTPVIDASFAIAPSSYVKDYYWNSVEVFSSPIYSAGVAFGVEMKEPHGALELKIGVQRCYTDYVDPMRGSRFEFFYVGVPILFGYRYQIGKTFSTALHIGIYPREMTGYRVDGNAEAGLVNWDNSLGRWHKSFLVELSGVYWIKPFLGVSMELSAAAQGPDFETGNRSNSFFVYAVGVGMSFRIERLGWKTTN